MNRGSGPSWSIVLPYFNEVDFIEPTIASAMALRTPCRLILVDNASTDGSEALCRRLLAQAPPHIEVVYLHETEPGPSHALSAGFVHVDTPFVAFWNADTVYRPDYLERADAILARRKMVAAMAIDLYAEPGSFAANRQLYGKWFLSQISSRQCHTGTFGQCFRTDVLRSAGGPLVAHWPWVLDDHELMQRIFKFGKAGYDLGFWCMPAARRGENAHVRWTFVERMLYQFTPFALKDWFFYRYLSPRFAARKMFNSNLRQRDWEATPPPALSRDRASEPRVLADL